MTATSWPRVGSSRRLAAAGLAAVVAISGLLSGCIFASPSVGRISYLVSVATVSKTNAWAVGNWSDNASAHDLIEHFDGHRWGVVPIPSTWGTGLTGITAINAANIWAVGGGRTLHWNGHAWTATLDPAGTTVTEVTSGRDGSLVAVGHTSAGPVVLASTLTGWRPLPLQPQPPSTNRACDGGLQLSNLTMTVKTDLWAVGSMQGTGGNAGSACTYSAHWNGTAWTTFDTPSPGDKATLAAVSAHGPSDVWAVGDAPFVDPSTQDTFDSALAMHWDGTSWHQVASPGGYLTDVDASGPHVWMVGTEVFGPFIETYMLIQRWSGSALVNQSMQHIKGPGVSQEFTHLSGVSARDGLVISVGGYQSGANTIGTLTDHRNDV